MAKIRFYHKTFLYFIQSSELFILEADNMAGYWITVIRMEKKKRETEKKGRENASCWNNEEKDHFTAIKIFTLTIEWVQRSKFCLMLRLKPMNCIVVEFVAIWRWNNAVLMCGRNKTKWIIQVGEWIVPVLCQICVCVFILFFLAISLWFTPICVYVCVYGEKTNFHLQHFVFYLWHGKQVCFPYGRIN